MTYAPTLATGNGSQVDFSFTFPYLSQLDVKVTVNAVPTTAFTFFSASILRFAVAPVNGADIVISRETPTDTLSTVIQPGSSLPVDGLNNNFLQSLYAGQEVAFISANQSTAGLQAQITTANNNANNAVVTANAAEATASGLAGDIATANANASSAVSTAGTANTNASNALVEAGNATTAATAAGLKVDNRIGYKNLIHNGSFILADIRGFDTPATPGQANAYLTDRWRTDSQAASRLTVEVRSSGGPTTALSTFGRITSAVLDASITSAEFDSIYQVIEGFNTRFLQWGSASPRTATLSFWVRSSVTGTYSVALQSSNKDRSYLAPFTITAANTWEFKTITVAGPTSGTWVYDSGRGLQVRWTLACGSNFLDTAGSWLSADRRGVTGQSNFLAASGRTFDITGVQLEDGAAATAFEHLPINEVQGLCQRYRVDIDPGAVSANSNIASGVESSLITFPVSMRGIPGVTTPTPALVNVASQAVTAPSNKTARIRITSTASGNFSADWSGLPIIFEADFNS